MVGFMDIKKYVDMRLVGIIGSVFMIVSQFVSWYSGLSLLYIYVLMTSIALEDSFLFLFPLISGSICLVGAILIIYKADYTVNSVIIIFIGLGFFLIFLIELIPQDFPYVGNAEIGFYFAILGALLVFLDIIYLLIMNKRGEG